MECNNTSSKRRRAGVTLVETMVAMTVGVLAYMMVNAFTIFSARSFAAMGNYASLEQKSSYALDRMSKDIRQTTQLLEYTPYTLVFTNDKIGSSVTYIYNPDNRTLTRIQNKDQANEFSAVLLEECDQLQFGVYKHNTVPGTFNQLAPGSASLNLTRVIQLHWVCSRQIMSAKLNTETVQSAKIVMRFLERSNLPPTIIF